MTHPRPAPEAPAPHPDAGLRPPISPRPTLRRPTVPAATLPVVLVALTAAAPLADQAASALPGRTVLAGLAGLTLFSAVIGRHHSTRLGLGLTATVAAAALPWQVSWWPLPGAVGVGVYLVAHLMSRRRPNAPPAILRLGRLSAREGLLVVGLVAVSASALLLFLQSAPPRLGPATTVLTTLSPGTLALAGVTFAMLNAFVEEVLFRGVILHHLQHALGTWTAVLTQAAAFGMLHVDGYPYGPIGVTLATAYGVLIGTLRIKSGGLLAPWIAHVCADIVIFAVIAHAAT